MPTTSQSEIRMLLFPFKLRDSATSAFVTMDNRAHMECKLEEIAGRNHLPVKRFDVGVYSQIRAKLLLML